MRLAPFVTRFRQRRGSVAVFTALAMTALLGSAALAIDVGFLYRQGMRLQLAADAGALGAARLLPAHTATTSTYQAAALSEVNGVSSAQTVGTLQTPVGASYAADWSTVTITLTSTPSTFFARAVGFVPSTISASAKAGATVVPPTACVLATSKTATDAIQVDNQGSIVATGCPIFSDSNAGTSIYLNSGTITGSSIGAVGGVVTSNSGSNVMSPSPGTSNAPSETDPFSTLTVPTYTNSCSTANTNVNDTSNNNGQPYVLQPGQYCGTMTVGGNGSTDQFQPGTYVIVNGSLVFNNADVTLASGVQFVLTGSSPGSFQWTNYSNTTAMTAPTSGTLAGILVWQTCNSSGSDSANTFNGGGTLQMSGSIYTPCGQLNMNNNAKLTAASNSSFGVVAQTIYATGSASIATSTASGSAAPTTTSYTLLQ
jgi:Flp pilus assembly protein TadG